MPLPVSSSEPLSIPAAEFNEHGLAVIMLSGGRCGGDWAIGEGRSQALAAVGLKAPQEAER